MRKLTSNYELRRVLIQESGVWPVDLLLQLATFIFIAFPSFDVINSESILIFPSFDEIKSESTLYKI